MLIMLLPVYRANAQDYIEYKISINQDNSATWLITKVSDVNAPIDTWESFQTKAYGVADQASAVTKRPMAIDPDSLQINTTISTSSKTTEYMFIWKNFSITQNNESMFGDVFAVDGFFTKLYGEASLQINYPTSLALKTVTPEPNSQDPTSGILRWYRTQDLENNPTEIVLTPKNDVNENIGPQHPLVLLGASAGGITIVLTASFLIIKRRRQTSQVNLNSEAPTIQVESEEDKILNLLKTAKGSMRQSDITDQCRFSKAKTSQLLTALEKRGVVTRYKSGRDKIVTLKDGSKGAK
ncbi:MAG: helix-turn-helix transcriptional regulator [Candidatus Bathyarchaeia archaeon]|jgi:uncharacterized membrane protein